jgi:RHH-type proline utilization regulon transcriptional repressor/proline dehydrogenase/delta 1-pyrroline-5-carboxylate dehydrogenase
MEGVLESLRAAVRQSAHADEALVVNRLLDDIELKGERAAAVRAEAISLVERCRSLRHREGTLDAFLHEFGLSNNEGIALMCLAEALLRVPDEDTADRLIAEKIQSGDWGAHRGRSASAFVNASVWGLMLTGRMVGLEEEITDDTGSWMRRLVSRLSEPVVRQAVLQAMRIMGGQYVLGRSIEEGLKVGLSRSRLGTRFSFDMLGEGARTAADAERHFEDYLAAIDRVGATVQGGSVSDAHGISIKLSALHPRYEFRQRRRVMEELLPRLRELALRARDHQMGFTIDAEECHRLELSMDLFEALARDPALAGWDGLGCVVQAYQKSAVDQTDWLVALARETGRRFMVRLVKGAYWDGEVKHAQQAGLADYPVFTRKCHSDLAYQRCTERLFAADDCVYPQFATHNAHTAALVLELAGERRHLEFQRLHGMGQLLFQELQARHPTLPIRIYAPIGEHRDLLPYLVRRLLENGANSSFVNRFMDAAISPEDLLEDPVEDARSRATRRHGQIPVPRQLYAEASTPWLNAAGLDLDSSGDVQPLLAAIADAGDTVYRSAPLVAGQAQEGTDRAVRNPADLGVTVGHAVDADAAAIDAALVAAAAAQPGWDALGGAARAERLEKLAELLEAEGPRLMGLIVAEAGRTIDDALSELREAVDFCRYYAAQGRRLFSGPQTLPGPTGELNELSLHGRGVWACISPWNFPLAIFTGQVAAALMAGNSVIAKPAEQTPLVAAETLRLMWQAGIPDTVVQLLPGAGESVGAALVADERITGVAFTGGTDTAKHIQRQLAAREGPIVPLIAETGGLNVMLVDATALPEQVVDDVITSAFRSAGQRCSALRVLYLQEDIADRVIEMLAGAMAELRVGNPAALATDVGPVISLDARHRLERHAEQMERDATLLARCSLDPSLPDGFYFAPQAFEIERLAQLPGEVFGPVLHVIRYAVSDMPRLLDEINASGFGLTLGVHSRIDGFAREIFEATRVGNTYINRNMVGAVVGVNPFGGQGLSGTGPKAGGPNYLLRFAAERTRTDNIVARGGNAQLFNLQGD